MLKLDQFEGLIISPDGEVNQIDPAGYPMLVSNPFHAIGAGAEIATGALAMGADAKEAVRLAIKYHTGCGGKIRTLKL